MLRDLGFKVDVYIASEVCEDSISVGAVRHEGKIQYVHDVRNISRKNVSDAPARKLLNGGSCYALHLCRVACVIIYSKAKGD